MLKDTAHTFKIYTYDKIILIDASCKLERAHTHFCKTEYLFTRLISISEFARDRPLYPNMFKTDKLSTVAAVNESQNSEIEMVSWQVRLTDQVRYHQHSSSVFVGARLVGLLAPTALKLKN